MAVALVVETGCATLGGTTRHFEEANVGTSVMRSSRRLPTQDRLEVAADAARDPAAIRARVSRVLTCQVLRSGPRIVTTTTTQTANRTLFGAEVAATLVGAIITAAAASSAIKACPSGNPDTCDISKATAWFSGVVTAPFLVSTVTDLGLTGGTERSTSASVVKPVQNEYVEECGREPAAHAQARLVLPDGEAIEQTSAEDGSLLFKLTGNQLSRFGSKFDVQLFVEGAPRSISVGVGE